MGAGGRAKWASAVGVGVGVGGDVIGKAGEASVRSGCRR